MSDTLLGITRYFDVEPERVFDAWLGTSWGDWIGPHGIRGEVTAITPEVGGGYAITMHQEGKPSIGVSGTYRVIDRPRKLVFTWIWQPGTVCGEGLLETVVTLDFRAEGKGCSLTLRHEGFATQDQCDGHNRGWTASLENLSALL